MVLLFIRISKKPGFKEFSCSSNVGNSVNVEITLNHYDIKIQKSPTNHALLLHYWANNSVIN